MSNAYMDRLENLVTFRVVCNVGTVPDVTPGGQAARLFLTVELRKGQQDPTHTELSITGVLGPKKNGDAWGSCGQNREDLLAVTSFADGWDRALAERTYEIWERWHLNGMNAGSPAQEDHLRTVTFPGYPMSHLDWAQGELVKVGLQPDPGFLVPSRGTKMVPYKYGFGKCKTQHDAGEYEEPGEMVPYSYGSRWIYQPLPDDVVEFIKALPQSTVAHPWGRH